MTIITRDDSCDGLDGFPAGYDPLARDDLGDVFATDRTGRVWVFPHGMGDWQQRSLAFASAAQLEEYVAFQGELEVPEGADVAALQDRKRRIEAFRERLAGAPYGKASVRQALADLREELSERRFLASKAGVSLANRQALGERCEQALRAAGAPGRWMIRPHVDEPRSLVAVGRFAAPWTEARVQELLQPILGTDYLLHCREAPPSW